MSKCALCEEKTYIRNIMDDLMKLNDNQLTIFVSNDISSMKVGGTFKVKFCPMCGEKIK